jgi:hypothetical protein
MSRRKEAATANAAEVLANRQKKSARFSDIMGAPDSPNSPRHIPAAEGALSRPTAALSSTEKHPSRHALPPLSELDQTDQKLARSKLDKEQMPLSTDFSLDTLRRGERKVLSPLNKIDGGLSLTTDASKDALHLFSESKRLARRKNDGLIGLEDLEGEAIADGAGYSLQSQTVAPVHANGAEIVDPNEQSEYRRGVCYNVTDVEQLRQAPRTRRQTHGTHAQQAVNAGGSGNSDKKARRKRRQRVNDATVSDTEPVDNSAAGESYMFKGAQSSSASSSAHRDVFEDSSSASEMVNPYAAQNTSNSKASGGIRRRRNQKNRRVVPLEMGTAGHGSSIAQGSDSTGAAPTSPRVVGVGGAVLDCRDQRKRLENLTQAERDQKEQVTRQELEEQERQEISSKQWEQEMAMAGVIAVDDGGDDETEFDQCAAEAQMAMDLGSASVAGAGARSAGRHRGSAVETSTLDSRPYQQHQRQHRQQQQQKHARRSARQRQPGEGANIHLGGANRSDAMVHTEMDVHHARGNADATSMPNPYAVNNPYVVEPRKKKKKQKQKQKSMLRSVTHSGVANKQKEKELITNPYGQQPPGLKRRPAQRMSPREPLSSNRAKVEIKARVPRQGGAKAKGKGKAKRQGKPMVVEVSSNVGMMRAGAMENHNPLEPLEPLEPLDSECDSEDEIHGALVQITPVNGNADGFEEDEDEGGVASDELNDGRSNRSRNGDGARIADDTNNELTAACDQAASAGIAAATRGPPANYQQQCQQCSSESETDDDEKEMGMEYGDDDFGPPLGNEHEIVVSNMWEEEEGKEEASKDFKTEDHFPMQNSVKTPPGVAAGAPPEMLLSNHTFGGAASYPPVTDCEKNESTGLTPRFSNAALEDHGFDPMPTAIGGAVEICGGNGGGVRTCLDDGNARGNEGAGSARPTLQLVDIHAAQRQQQQQQQQQQHEQQHEQQQQQQQHEQQQHEQQQHWYLQQQHHHQHHQHQHQHPPPPAAMVPPSVQSPVEKLHLPVASGSQSLRSTLSLQVSPSLKTRTVDESISQVSIASSSSTSSVNSCISISSITNCHSSASKGSALGSISSSITTDASKGGALGSISSSNAISSSISSNSIHSNSNASSNIGDGIAPRKSAASPPTRSLTIVVSPPPRSASRRSDRSGSGHHQHRIQQQLPPRSAGAGAGAGGGVRGAVAHDALDESLGVRAPPRLGPGPRARTRTATASGKDASGLDGTSAATGLGLASRSGSAGTGLASTGLASLETDAEFRQRMNNLQLDICGGNSEQSTYMRMHRQYEKHYEQTCTSPHPRIVVGSLGFAKEGKADFLQMEVYETLQVKERPVSR